MIESASDKVLAWCRKQNGIVMRNGDGRCNLWDNGLIEPEMVFSGESWQQVWDEYCALRPVAAPAPEPVRPTYTRRYYRRGRR